MQSILNQHSLNCTSWTYKFKMLTHKGIISQIWSNECFVTIDLNFHIDIWPEHRKPSSITMHFHKVRTDSSVTPGHLHTDWHWWLVYPSSFGRVESLPAMSSVRLGSEAVGCTAFETSSCSAEVFTLWITNPGSWRLCSEGLFLLFVENYSFFIFGPTLGPRWHRKTLSTDTSLISWGAFLNRCQTRQDQWTLIFNDP